ncbi:MAG TPA: hypothetical protein VLG10_12725 [Methylomirabilota bacterium]|nr:hypothetical protein [Methylomirabilota bacterium]
MDDHRPAEAGTIIRVVADIGRHEAEALRIELINLARRYGLEPGRGRVKAGRRHQDAEGAAEGNDA